MLSDSKWDYQFGLTYSVTLSNEDLETSLVVRNTGEKTYGFQVLFHTYFQIDVSFTQGNRQNTAIDLLSVTAEPD